MAKPYNIISSEGFLSVVGGTVINFDTIISGAIAEKTFILKNMGSQYVQIVNTRASCGCTTIMLKQDLIKPGDSTALKVSIDTKGKAPGNILKNVRIATNSTVLPEIIINMKATISEPQSFHREKMISMNVKQIFSGECRSCHVTKGEGKMGQALYQADCEICHSATNQPSAIPALTNKVFQSHSEEKVRNIIENGIHGANMPPFLKKAGGILEPEEINSLITYLHALPG
jgi:cytochrome c2